MSAKRTTINPGERPEIKRMILVLLMMIAAWALIIGGNSSGDISLVLAGMGVASSALVLVCPMLICCKTRLPELEPPITGMVKIPDSSTPPTEGHGRIVFGRTKNCLEPPIPVSVVVLNEAETGGARFQVEGGTSTVVFDLLPGFYYFQLLMKSGCSTDYSLLYGLNVFEQETKRYKIKGITLSPDTSSEV